jgi:hypothetical protein
LIAVRESCEDVREKMEAKQLRWLERGNLFTSRSEFTDTHNSRGAINYESGRGYDPSSQIFGRSGSHSPKL